MRYNADLIPDLQPSGSGRISAEAATTRTMSARGHPLELPEPNPWPNQVDGAALIRDLFKAFKQHIVLGRDERVALALWVVHTHAFAAADTAPRLAITSPDKRCGKSTLMEMLTYLVPRPLPASNLTPATVFRAIEAAHPTLLIDEADTFLRDNRELRGVLNSGHKRSHAYVVRNVRVGDDYEPRQFSTWAPIAVALIGRLPSTLEDRSIEIRMRRKLQDERVERLDKDARYKLRTLARKCARWAKDNRAALEQADPNPDALDDRATDNWRPLLAIAQVANAPPSDITDRAAVSLSRRRDDAAGEGVELLRDIKPLFKQRKGEFLGSKDLLASLTNNPLLRWKDYREGRPLSERRLADLLKEFGIYPASNGAKRGYKQCDFGDAFQRYLPSG